MHGRYPFRSRRRGIQRVFDAGAHKKQKPEKALEHYDYIASLYREVYGVSPSAELEAQKALAVQEIYGSETSEDDIQTFLLEKEQETGAFCCDNNVFREIVNLHVREMRRNDTPAALMIVRLANRSIDPEKRAVYMKQMEVTLLNELRAGDPFTKVGANQFGCCCRVRPAKTAGSFPAVCSIGSKRNTRKAVRPTPLNRSTCVTYICAQKKKQRRKRSAERPKTVT